MLDGDDLATAPRDALQEIGRLGRAAVVRPLSWIWRQASAGASNLRGVFDREFAEERAGGWFAFTIMAPVNYYGGLLNDSVFGYPREQLFASLVLAATLIIASFGILTIVAVAVFGPLLVVSLLRMLPAFNDRYVRLKGRVEGDAKRGSRWIRDR